MAVPFTLSNHNKLVQVQIVAPKQTNWRSKLTKSTLHQRKLWIQFTTTIWDDTILQTFIIFIILNWVSFYFWIQIQNQFNIIMQVICFANFCTEWGAVSLEELTESELDESELNQLELDELELPEEYKSFSILKPFDAQKNSQKPSFSWEKMSTSTTTNKFSLVFVMNTCTSDHSNSWWTNIWMVNFSLTFLMYYCISNYIYTYVLVKYSFTTFISIYIYTALMASSGTWAELR